MITIPEAIACALAAAGGVGTGLLLRGGEKRQPPTPAGEKPFVHDARFEQLINSMTVGVIMLDRRGAITAVNPAAAVIFEFGSKSFVGRAIIEAVPSFEIDRRVRAALAGNPSRGSVELKEVPRSRHLAVSTIPLDGEDGAILIASDETHLRELESSRGDFIANVSHELRSPLSSVKLMVETLLENGDDAEVREMFLPRVEQEVDRMVELVRDLLDLARGDAGSILVRRESLDLTSLTGAVVQSFEVRALQAGVRLRLEGSCATVMADASRMKQVIVNLVDNALRHTPEGGTVTVTVRPEGSEVVLIVADTGDGIPYNDLPRIFDRFYVVERSRARAASGTGLGLSIVKQIVEAHGGRVSAASDFGFGATFTCRFPAAVPEFAELLR